MHRLDARCARKQRGVGVNHSREIAGLWARSLTASKAAGGEAEACAYCEVALAGAHCVSRRVSTGFGAANVTDQAFCDQRCRGRYDQRGPKNASQWAGSAGNRPTHRNTLAPYQDDEGGGSIGATRRLAWRRRHRHDRNHCRGPLARHGAPRSGDRLALPRAGRRRRKRSHSPLWTARVARSRLR